MRKIRLCICVLLLAAFTACATTDNTENVERAGAYFKIGVAYLNENKVQQAFVEFQKAYDLNPQNHEVLNAIGIIYLLHFDEHLRSIEYFEKAVRVNPSYSEAYNNLGFAHEKLGRYEAAISFYRKAVANMLYATPEKAFVNMGNAYYRIRDFDSAIYAYREAIKRAPTLSIAYMRMSLCFNAMSRYGDAASAMTEAIRLDPFYRGDREKALEDFRLRRLRASGTEEQDLSDYLEILKY